MTTITAPRTFGSFQVDDITSAPLQYTKSIQLNTSQQTLFDFLIQHDRWSEWFPIVKSVEVDSREADIANGNGTVRVCTLVNGAILNERIYAYEAPHQFAYAVAENNPMGLENHLAVVQLEANGHDATTLNWFQFFNHPDLEAIIPQINDAIEAGLQRLVERYGRTH